MVARYNAVSRFDNSEDEMRRVMAKKAMNNHPSLYMIIHHNILGRCKLRKKYNYILKIYTIYYFQKYFHIHQQLSPSINVL